MFALVLSPFVSYPMSPFVFPFCWLACPPSRYLVSTFPPLSRPHMCACVGWCVCILDVLSLPCLPMFPIVFPHVCLCWMVRPPSWRLVSHCLPTCVPVLDGVSAFPRSRLPFSPLLSHWAHCLALSPHTFACVGWWVCLPNVLSSLFVSDCLSTCVPVMVCLPSLASRLSAIVSHCLPTICVCVGWCVRLRKVLSPLVVFHRSLASMVCPPFQGLVSPGPPLLHILSHCLPACVHLCWMVCPPSRSLVSPCLPSCLSLSPVVSTCFPLSPVASNCFPLSPHMCLRWMVHLPEVLVFIASHGLPRYVWPVLHGASTFPRSCLPLVSHCLPSCFSVLDGVSTFPMFCLLCLLCLPACLPSCLPVCLPTCLSSCFPLWWVVWFFQTAYCWGRLSFGVRLGVGWCVRLPEVLSPILSPSLSLFLFPCSGWSHFAFFPKQCTVRGS